MNRMTLIVPAQEKWGIVVRSALNGVGVMAELSSDMIDDLRSAVEESFDLLMHQSRQLEHVKMICEIVDDNLQLRICAERAPTFQQCEAADPEVARLIIGSFVTDAHLEGDSCGISCVQLTLPVGKA